MSGKKSPTSTQQAPSFYEDPYYSKSQGLLFPIAEGLSRGRFMDSSDPTVGFLNELVRLNPKATQEAVGLATRDIDSQQKSAFQEVISQLEANNQLESSVTGNRLADLQEDYARNISDVNTRFYLADVERALGNMSNLFQLGLGTASDVRGGALTNQSQKNEFELKNYENRVTAELLNKQQKTGGGWMGALTGAVGGGLSGFAIGGPFGALIGAGLGGVSGGMGSPGTGGQFLNTGALLQGLGKQPSFMPGSSASNDPFGRLNSRSVGLSSGDSLLDRFGFSAN